MKQMKITTLLMLFVALLFTQPSFAMIETTTNASTTIEKQKTELKKEFKAEKRMAKFEKLFKKAGVDFKDPVNKWMWFWIFGWGAAIVLSVIASAIAVGSAGAFGSGFGIAAIVALIGWLAGLFGTVSLIIWIVKKFG